MSDERKVEKDVDLGTYSVELDILQDDNGDYMVTILSKNGEPLATGKVAKTQEQAIQNCQDAWIEKMKEEMAKDQ